MPQNDQSLKGLRVAILTTDGFEQAELVEPRKALDQAGAKTTVIAPKSGKIQGMQHDEKGDSVSVDMTLEQADADNFDAVLLPGGALNADALRMVQPARNFVRKMDSHRKPIAVICHGSWLLVSSGLTFERTLTSYFTIQDDIRNAGGIWVDQEVVQDRNWISSRKPDDIPAFNRKILAVFGEAKAHAKGA
jgi:protease I